MVTRITLAFSLLLAGSSATDIAWRRYAENAKDVEFSGSDFVPQYHPFHFNQPLFGAPQNLPFQQSHLLGFQHRFQPGFSSNQFNTPLLNQPNFFQGQQSQLQQVLIPPQQTPVLSPPPLNSNSGRSHQTPSFSQNSIESFRPPAPPTLQNQLIRNQGQNVRFPQQNFIGQDQAFANQHANFQRVLPQQPFVNSQSQPPQLPQPQPSHIPQSQPQHHIQSRPQQPPQSQPQPQPQLHHQPQQPINGFNQIVNGFNPQFQQQRPLINQQPSTNQPPVVNSQSLQQQALLNQQQLLINHQQAILNQQQNFRQNFPQQVFSNGQGFQQAQQPNFIPFNQQPQNVNANTPKPTVFPPTTFPKTSEGVFRSNVIQNPIQRPAFEFQPGVQSQQGVTKFQEEQNRATQNPTTVQTDDPNILLQKSQEHHQYLLGGNYLAAGKENEATQTTRPTTLVNFQPTTPAKPKTPKPIVKEIRINLDENNNPVTDTTPQLYIKDIHQKQFQQIRQQQSQVEPQQSRREKSHKLPVKNDKTQEELINEQIQKLLQRHNLEIIDKEKESSESQEAQLSQFSRVLKGKYNYNVQLVSGGSILKESKDKKSTPTVIAPTLPPLPELPDHIKKDYDIKLVNRDDFLKQFDIVGAGGDGVPQLGNNTLFLANGQDVELVSVGPDGKMKKIPLGKKTSKKSVVTPPTTTIKPPKVLFEELAKGAIPPGADFELIRQNENGEIEKVTDVSNSKKVTFVLLEEQPDGSVKVQGVKGNGNSESSDRDSVNSIIKSIKEGTLKLPPAQQKPPTNSIFTNEIPRFKSPTIKSFVTLPPSTTAYKTTRFHVSTVSPFVPHFASTPEPPTPTPTEGFYDIYADINAITTENPTLPPIVRRQKQKQRISFLPTLPSLDATVTSTFPSQRIKPTSSSTFLLRTTPTPKAKSPKRVLNKLSSKYEEQSFTRTEPTTFRPTEFINTEVYTTPVDVIAEESNIDSTRPVTEILKERGLNQMAKFLDQSGLDTILNETGPYTIFIPTDKAFKALEAQLGGTDRAEDKFRENPRLLSGLLLHHVVPGSFRVEDLQDEMTGVSLAGTQLRVNTYDEKKSKNQKIVTINGARVSTEDRDINVPQGLAHAVDRVLFPLPVGDILQTLRGDRERRFTKFIKSLEASGLADMLTGSKTYTVFAPTDSAFSALTDSELDKLLTRREAAKTIVQRHIVPGTLYGAGMQYYQLKETMEKGQKIAIYKESGKIKANSAEVISSNIPATNGVVHVVETLL